jgi:hypothetical protein
MSKYYSSTLQKGSKGNEVSEWQKFLNSQGYNLTVDGDFGDNTHKATLEWQTKNGLGADGIVGENTWGKAGYTPYSTISTPTAAPTIDPAPEMQSYIKGSWDDSEKGQETWQAYRDAVEKVEGYGDFTYGNQQQLNDLMKQILNREKFTYDLNGDAFYQQYKDKYTQQAKMAMGDAIGQASAMTGGYGNSYAQSVGQQMYQKEMQNLNDIAPELYQMALDKYQMEGQDLYNQYGLLSDDYNREYGEWTDSYGRDMDMLGILSGDYYNGGDMFYADQNSKNNIIGMENNDAMSIWQANTDNAWEQAQWDEAARQYANEESWRQKEWDREEQWRNEDIARAGSGGNGGNGGVSLENIPGINTKDASYFDDNGNFKKAEFLGSTQDGRSSFRIGGKTVVLDKGVNPYTQTYNKDCKHGTFSNGYQPNNINNQKLSKSGIQDYMNGVLQTVWKTPDGNLWIWDGTQNKYEEYHE